MSKSLDQFEYEMQHQRFLKALRECMDEVSEEETLDLETTGSWVKFLVDRFHGECEAHKIPYKFQFIAVATLVFWLMTTYDGAPVDLDV